MFTLSLLTDKGYLSSVTLDRSALREIPTFLVMAGYLVLGMRAA